MNLSYFLKRLMFGVFIWNRFVESLSGLKRVGLRCTFLYVFVRSSDFGVRFCTFLVNQKVYVRFL